MSNCTNALLASIRKIDICAKNNRSRQILPSSGERKIGEKPQK